MKAYSIIPILMTAMFLTACGGSGGGSDDGDDSSSTPPPDSTQPPVAQPPAVAKDLQGSWRRSCLYDSKIELYRTQDYAYSGNEYDYSSLFFEDRDCYSLSNAKTEYVESGTYVVGSLVTTSTGLKANNLTHNVEFKNGQPSSDVEKKIYKVDGSRLYLSPDYAPAGSNNLDLDNPYYKR